MANRNDASVLIVSLLVTLGLLGAGGWWLTQHLGIGRLASNTSTPSSLPNSNQSSTNTLNRTDTTVEGASHSSPEQSNGELLNTRLSTGDQSLLAETVAPLKQQAIAAIQVKDYSTAIELLESYLQQNRNDPEALIYLNNARVGEQPGPTIAVAVPAATALNPAKEILRGVAQAQDEVNVAGGINGKLLKVVIASDDNEPEIASKVADLLVAEPSILGVIGHFGSGTSLEAGKIYEQGKLVMISPTSTSVQISDAGSYIFRTVPSDRFTANALSRHLINHLNLQNAVLFYNADSDYSQSLKNELTTALYADGGQVIAEVNVADDRFDATNSVTNSIQQGAQALILATNTATLDQSIQIIQANNQRMPLFGGDSLYNPALLEFGGQQAEDMVVAVPWILLSNPEAPFVQSSRQQWGGDVNWRTAMAYDGAISLIEAIRQNPTRVGVQQTLSSSSFRVEAATGLVQFLPSGDRNQAMQLVRVTPGTRSGFGYDFIPVQP